MKGSGLPEKLGFLLSLYKGAEDQGNVAASTSGLDRSHRFYFRIGVSTIFGCELKS